MLLSRNIRTQKSGQSCNVRNVQNVMSVTQHLWCCMGYTESVVPNYHPTTKTGPQYSLQKKIGFTPCLSSQNF